MNDLKDYITANKSPYNGKEIVTQIHEATKFVSNDEQKSVIYVSILLSIHF